MRKEMEMKIPLSLFFKKLKCQFKWNGMDRWSEGPDAEIRLILLFLL